MILCYKNMHIAWIWLLYQSLHTFASTVPECISSDETSDLTYEATTQFPENDCIFDSKIILNEAVILFFIIKIFIQIYSLIKDNDHKFKEFGWSFYSFICKTGFHRCVQEEYSFGEPSINVLMCAYWTFFFNWTLAFPLIFRWCATKF